MFKVAYNFRTIAEFYLQEAGGHFQHLLKKKKWNDRYNKVLICIDLEFDEINVIQAFCIVIKSLLKFVRLMGYLVCLYSLESPV